MVSADASAQALSSSSEKRVVVYTTSGCHKCRTLKDWLRTSNTVFEERDLEDVNVMADLVMRNIVVLSAPVLEVNAAIYSEAEFFNGDALATNKLRGILEGNGYGR